MRWLGSKLRSIRENDVTAIPIATDSRAERIQLARGARSGDPTRRAFVLQSIQPALLGLMDGAVSTLAPIFAAAGLTGRPLSAFFVGLAASLGAAISMGLSEALSDDGSVTGRGGPIHRGTITGVATGIGGMLHTLPFLIPDLGIALRVAYAVVFLELLAIAFIRYRFMGGRLANTIVQVIIGGGIVFAVGFWLGRIGAG
jgi:VIT1/CCC1 family predicted Fe2+/Mn2+ transporter